MVLSIDTVFIKFKAKPVQKELTLFHQPCAEGWRVSWALAWQARLYPLCPSATSPVLLLRDLGAQGRVAHSPPASVSQWGFTYMRGAASLSMRKSPEEMEVCKKDDWRVTEDPMNLAVTWLTARASIKRQVERPSLLPCEP